MPPLPGAVAPRVPRDDLVVAIDGPAGAGKSTVARALAQQLQFRYLDTGALYRAATLGLLRRGVAAGDERAVAEAVERLDLRIEPSPGHRGLLRVLLDGEAPGRELRARPVNAAVSPVSAVPAVRARLVELLRAAMAGGGVVAEGRDVGTVVWPGAEVKVYLTADPAERARRRGGRHGSAESASEVERRDRLDSGRAAAPLQAAPDAVVLDSTRREVSGIVADLVAMVAAARPAAAGRAAGEGSAVR